MFQFQTVTTEGLAAHRKVQFWNEVTSQMLTEQCATPADAATFCGHLRGVNLGEIQLAEISASASTVARTRTHIAHASEAPFVFRYLLSGELHSSQDGTETTQKPGDFALYDTARPYRLTLRDDTTLLSIRIRKARLLQHIPFPERIASVVVSGASEAGRLTSRFLREFWCGSSCLAICDAAPRIADIALQLIASSYAMLPESRQDRSSLVARHRLEIVLYIEKNLRSPSLSPGSVAAALRISPGYAHRIFSNEAQSIGRYILRRRLERCCDALSDHLQAGRTITDIAFAFGFTSVAHFSRVFREQYGVPPREYRAERRTPT